jgi:iron complex outermembrane receptor protein
MGRFSFFGGINNLLNRAYFDNIRINAYGKRYYEPAPLRNTYLGVNINL